VQFGYFVLGYCQMIGDFVTIAVLILDLSCQLIDFVLENALGF
jgi:hypothetical protein